MALFRKFFYRKPPDGLLEISERVYVFDCCFSTDVLEEDDYEIFVESIVSQLRKQFPDSSYMVFNFKEGERQSLISNILSEYDMLVMDYPRQYEGCPLLTMEMIHHFLRSCESWLSLGQQNILLMHCERGGWSVLAFMLAGLLIYRKQYTGEHKTLDMIYKQAPRELLQLLSPLNPLPSQLRYLQYVSRRNVGAEWPPLDRALTLDCVILRVIPNFNCEGGCRPIFKIYGQDPFICDRTPKVLFPTPGRRNSVRLYKQSDCELVKIDIHCHIQGDVVLECINLSEDLVREEMMFRVMFNTAFIRSNILMLNRDEIDILWNAKDRFPKDFRAEILLSEMDATNSLITVDLSGGEKEGLPMEAFSKVQEIFSTVDWLDTKADAALQEKLDAVFPGEKLIANVVRERINLELLEQDTLNENSPRDNCKRNPPPLPFRLEQDAVEEILESSSSGVSFTESSSPPRQPSSMVKPSPKSDVTKDKVQHQEVMAAVQRPVQSKILSQRVGQASSSNPASYCNSLQGSSLPMSRYHSVPSALGITALLQDHVVSFGTNEVSKLANKRVPQSQSSAAQSKPVGPSYIDPMEGDSKHLSSSSKDLNQPPLNSSSSEPQSILKPGNAGPRPLPPPPLNPVLASVPSLMTKTSLHMTFTPPPSSLASPPPPPPPPLPPPVMTALSVASSSSATEKMADHPPPPPPPPPLETMSMLSSSSSVTKMAGTPPPPPPLPMITVSVSSPSSVRKLAAPPPPPPPPPLPPMVVSSVPSSASTTKKMVGPPSPPPPPVIVSSMSSSASITNEASDPPPPPPPPPLVAVSSVSSSSSLTAAPPPPPSMVVFSEALFYLSPPPPPPPLSGLSTGISAMPAAPVSPPPPPLSGPSTSISAMPAAPARPLPPPLSAPSTGISAMPAAPAPPPPPPLSGPSTSISAMPAAPAPPLPPRFSQGLPSRPPVPPPPAPSGSLPFSKGPGTAPGGSKAAGGPGPPPPALAPNFGAKGRGLRSMSPKAPTTSKRSTLKPLHWVKVTRAMQGSLWAEAQKQDEASKAPEFDMKELENLFSAVVPPSDHGKGDKSSRRASVGGKPDKVHLIEMRRAYNCEIMLTKVKMPLPDLMSSVLALDEAVLDVDQVDNLIKFCPTKEEIELLKGYTGDKENLGRCEQFFLEVMKVPRVESKLRVFSFKIQFGSQVSDLRNSLNIVNSAAEEIRMSAKLYRIMQTILSLGNAINHGTARGSAIGFRLDSLLKLYDTRARNNKMTLMHYLCKVLGEKLPELLDFHKDLVNLEISTKIQLKILAEEMQAISKGLEKVEQELTASENDGPVSESFCKTLKEFLVTAEAGVRSLTSLYSGVGRNADALAIYFGEDPARCPFEQVVSTLLNFVRMFNRAHEENRKQLELEKKKAQKEAENEKMKVATPKKSSEQASNSPVKSGKTK
ncbi:formin-like protein 18 [Aristolochia californica]|uniref:formin-like protein 18 n=1 Tax=Aristolochia californica TaxID=171875 RepID=UPI0035E34531